MRVVNASMRVVNASMRVVNASIRVFFFFWPEKGQIRNHRCCGGEPDEEGRRHEDAGDYVARLRAYAAVGADEGW